MQSRRVAVRGIVLKDDKLFCVQLKPYEGKAVHDGLEYWCLPGGGVDVGEPLLPALEREMIEEIGVKPLIGNLLYVQQFAHKDREHMEFFFHITNADDYLNVDLSQTTHGATEIERIEFIDPTQHTVLPEFLAQEPLADFVHTYSGPKFFNYL